MSETPRVSVILRTRNRPWYLRQALEGLADQTYRSFEALVINDGGDDVSSLLADFEGRVPIRYFHHDPGRGRCAAANRGLAEARGELIAYLDDDDRYLPEHLETLAAAFDDDDVHVAYTNAWDVRHSPRTDGEGYDEVSREVKLAYPFSRGRFFMHSFIHLVTFMHRKACIEPVGGFDESLEVLEDLDLYLRLAQVWDFHHLDRTTAEYRIRDDRSNAVTALTEAFLETRRQLMTKYIHMVLPELIAYTEHKDHIVQSLLERVEAIEAKLADR